MHLARVSEFRGNRDAAQNAYENSLEENPSNGETLLEYARFCIKQKRYVKAELLLARASAIQAVEQRALLAMAQLFIEMKDYEAALKHARAALTKFPELHQLQEKISVLENILSISEG
jgi:tetratricopeptide (TPR) repeat protein